MLNKNIMGNKNKSKRHHVIFNIKLDKTREIMFKMT